MPMLKRKMKSRHMSIKKVITRKLIESSEDHQSIVSSQKKGTGSVGPKSMQPSPNMFEEVSNFNINRRDTFFHNMKVLDYQEQIALVFR